MKSVGESGQQSSFKATNATLATLLTLKVNVFLFLGFLAGSPWSSPVEATAAQQDENWCQMCSSNIHSSSQSLY